MTKNPQKPTKKPKKGLKIKQKRFIEAYIKKLGNITAACKEAKVKDRTTYYDWLEKSEFKQEMDNAIELHNDLVYQRILKIALENDKDMLKFWAKNQMKHRGFVEKQEIEHLGEQINIKVNIPEEVKKLLEEKD